LRINRQRHYCETQHDQEIASPGRCSVALRHGPSRVQCARGSSPSFLRGSFPHASLRAYQTTNNWPSWIAQNCNDDCFYSDLMILEPARAIHLSEIQEARALTSQRRSVACRLFV